MERKIYLKRYRTCVDQVGIPVVIRRSAGEATFQADDLQSGEQVALQIAPPAAWRDARREQIEADARAAQKINQINLPVLRDFGFENEQLVLVTEYFTGTTVQEWVQTRGPMPVSVALRIAAQILSALSAAIFHGIVHPALHPANLMLVPGETPAGDWPLIKVLNLISVANNAPDSRAFASPEEIAGGAADFRSEIYSLGRIIRFLLKPATLAAGASSAQAAPELPAPVRRLLAQMLAANPAERPLDPVALQRQIQDCLEQLERGDARPTKIALPSHDTHAFEQPTTTKPRPNRLMPLALAALLLALATLVSVVLANRFQQRPSQVVAVPAAQPSSSVPSAEPSLEITTDASESSAREPAEPPVLVSEANVPNEQDGASSEAADAPDSGGNMALASSESEISESPKTESDAAPSPAPETLPVIAENSGASESSSEPAPPAEGPAEDVKLAREATESGAHDVSVPENAPSEVPARPSALVLEKLGGQIAPTPSPVLKKREPRRHARKPIKDPFRELPVLRALPPD